MSTRISIPNPRRELARRLNGGIEVTLYWNAHDDSTSIEVWQPATEETLIFPVARERALDAFYHPFAHLARDPGTERNLTRTAAQEDYFAWSPGQQN